jgi:hypothetical protein
MTAVKVRMQLRVARGRTANKPLQRTNAALPARSSAMPRRLGLRPRLLAAVVRSNATWRSLLKGRSLAGRREGKTWSGWRNGFDSNCGRTLLGP